MGIEVTGRLHTIFATQQVSERFTKREFVVEMSDNSTVATNWMALKLVPKCASIFRCVAVNGKAPRAKPNTSTASMCGKLNRRAQVLRAAAANGAQAAAVPLAVVTAPIHAKVPKCLAAMMTIGRLRPTTTTFRSDPGSHVASYCGGNAYRAVGACAERAQLTL